MARPRSVCVAQAELNLAEVQKFKRSKSLGEIRESAELVHVPAMCDHGEPLIPRFRHPEALAPLGASLEGRRSRPFILRGPRARARPPQDDGIWIELTETRSKRGWFH